MQQKYFQNLITASVLVLAGTAAGGAQTITGSINGTVTDPSGAIVPNATVTAKNVGTGVETKATTNGSGDYNIRFLQVGQYQVTISGPGFAPFVSGQFTLEVNQTAKMDAKLAPAGATQTVTVSGNVQPILDTDNSTIAGNFSANTISNLPLNGRNFSSVTEFVPGAISTTPSGMTGVNAIERDTNQNGQVSVNGNRNQTNSYLLDGVEINETINNVIGYNPSPDAIGNMTVITSNANAEYGNVNGGDVIALLKSGTDHYHGSVFGFVENDSLDANSWANNFSGTAKQPFTESYFGGTVGGPIIKNKLFFFADYQASRYHTGGTETASVIPQAFRNGDFSSIPTQLVHVVNGVNVPYVNNQVPITNPVAAYLFAHPELYPLPNKTATDGIAENNYIGNYRNWVRNDQGDIKVDYHLGQKDAFFVRYSQGEASDATPQTPIAITFPGTNSYPFKGIAINETHSFSSAIINEFRAGWSRVRWVQGIPVDTTGAFGLTGDSVVGIDYPNQPYPGFAFQDFSSSQGADDQSYITGVGTTGLGSSLIDNIFTYADDLTWQLGRHTLKMGAEILRYQQNNFYPGNDGIMGRMQYGGGFTGNNIADFDTDQVYYAGISGNVGRTGQRQYRDAGFIQDDWRPTDHLTVNLGLRYEYDQPIFEVNDKQANVDLATGQYYYAGTQAAAEVFGDGHALYHPVYTNFMPRIGFAFQPNQRWVFRGGYGITNFLEGTGANLRLNFNPPFQPTYTYTATNTDTDTTVPTGASPALMSQTALPADFTASTSSNTLRAWQNHLRPAFIQEFTLSTEYELDNQTSIFVGYVGQSGQHLIDARAGNQLYAAGTTAPYANLVGQTGSIVVTEAESMMNYNGLQVQARRRQHNGLEFTVNYTYSKGLSNNPGFFGANSAGNNGPNYSAYWQNGYDGHADYGPSSMDSRHNLSATGVYELPFGRGRQFGGNMNPWLNEVAGGWKISGTAIAFSGLPITIAGPNTTSVNNKASRANQYKKLVVENRSIGHWYGTGVTAGGAGNDCATSSAQADGCAYGPTIGNEFGSSSNGSERAPGFEQVDLTAGKVFAIKGSQNVEFRADFFNAFNIASYNYPDSNITDTTFGQITDTRSQPRIVQFSGHYNF